LPPDHDLLLRQYKLRRLTIARQGDLRQTSAMIASVRRVLAPLLMMACVLLVRTGAGG
jgi:hypothetical protein